jgi:hypothetical protein
MVSNFVEQQDIFQVLMRGMVSSFSPEPTGQFMSACKQFGETIKPAVESFSGAESVVCCFWDQKIKQAAMLSSISDRSVTFAIICEHIVRVISGESCYYDERTTNTTVH